MKKILLSLAAVAAVGAAAAPAAAQPWRDHSGYGDSRYDHRADYRNRHRTVAYVDGLKPRIDAAIRSGRVSRSKASDLRRDYRWARDLAWRVQSGQAQQWQVQRLDGIIYRIEQAVDRGRYADSRDHHDGWRR